MAARLALVMIKKEDNKMRTKGLTRRGFVKTGAGAVVAASLLPVLNRHAVALGEHTVAGTTSAVYVCTPCGLDCDKLEFDKPRSEEHTSELQSRLHLVCRLLLEKKK